MKNQNRQLLPLLNMALLGALVVVPAATLAEEVDNSEPQIQPTITKTAYADWLVVCAEAKKREAPVKKQCQMVQTLSIEKDQVAQPFLQTTLVRQGEKRLLEIVVPLGVDLRPGLGIQVDNNAVGTMPYITCNANGCAAIANVDDAFWQQLRGGLKAKVAIRGFGQTENTLLEISLKGFTAASNALMVQE